MAQCGVYALARDDARVRLLMSAPGVGAIVALSFAPAIDDPSRFKSSKMVGPHFGLTPMAVRPAIRRGIHVLTQ